MLRDTNPTPTSATVPKGGNNKRNKKSQEKDDDESDGKPPKRLKITYARGDKGDLIWCWFHLAQMKIFSVERKTSLSPGWAAFCF